MKQIASILIFLIYLPFSLGYVINVVFEKQHGDRWETKEHGLYNCWAMGMFCFMGICGIVFGAIPNVVSVKLCIYVLLVAVTIIFIPYRMWWAIKNKIWRNMLDNDLGMDIRIGSIVFAAYSFLFVFVSTVVEDTAYYSDNVSDVLSVGLGESFYNLLYVLTGMKEAKLVYYFIPIVLLLFAYAVYQNLISQMHVEKKIVAWFMFALAFIYLFPVWKPEWNGYNFFGRLWDTLTFVSCIYAPLVMLWILYFILLIRKMCQNKRADYYGMIWLLISLVFVIGIGNLCGLPEQHVAQTPIEEIIYVDQNTFYVVRRILQVYGVGRFHYAILPLLMLILFYIEDDKKSPMLLYGFVVLMIYFMPFIAGPYIKNYGCQGYADVALLWNVPIFFAYTVARGISLCDKAWKRICVFVGFFIMLFLMCIFNTSLWGEPQMFTRGGV